MPVKIIDEFTDLPVSRQRKHQLRHPERMKVLQRKYARTEKGRISDRKSSLKVYYKNKEYYNEYNKQYQIKNNL